ncbi:MAG TPA: branched-chain amino acid ABC transporter ATP-binding protein/permease [Candidatus Binatia bacterium]|nr:branched-chain amino acid ABC transporter ATP-binding protein/permease [Candidatus Binatia bacterium]
MRQRLSVDLRLLLIFAAAVVVFGVVGAHDATLIQAATYGAIYAVVAIGLSLLLGNVNLVSIGQAGFFAIGAYAVAYLTASFTWPAGVAPWEQYLLATLLGVVLSGLLGVVLGFITLRFQGPYLAMATLAFGAIVVGLLRYAPAFGGVSGISNVPYAQIGPFAMSGIGAYWYAWFLVALAALATTLILRGRIGRAFEAIRNDPLAAEVAGIPVRRYTIGAFTYAGMLAGLAGTFYSSYLGLVVPDAVGITVSIDVLLMVILGGAGTVSGAVLGAAIIGFTNLYGHSYENLRPILYGIAVICVAIFLPRGLTGLLWYRTGRRTEATALPPAPAVAVPRAEIPAGTRWLEIEYVSKHFGGLVAVDDVSFALENGTVTSLIGPNGAGKTTLFNAICGVVHSDGGKVCIGGRDVTGWQPHRVAALGAARSFQNARLFGDMTVAENVAIGAFASKRVGDADIAAALTGYGVAHMRDTPARDLAFGDRRRVELARAAAGRPGLLLLDEPAAGLNADERRRLRDDITALRRDGITVLLIEHDMSLVMDVSDRVIVLEFGKVIADGKPGEVQQNAAVVEAYLGAEA